MFLRARLCRARKNILFSPFCLRFVYLCRGLRVKVVTWAKVHWDSAINQLVNRRVL